MAPDITLSYPVYTFENKILVSPGTTITREILHRLRHENKVVYPAILLFDHGTVAADVRKFMRIPPYDRIFADRQQTEQVLAIMARIHVIAPVLWSLDYFKQHDYHTYRHMLMVSVLSCFFGCHLISDFKERLKDSDCIQEAMTGPTHDIGKVNVPLSVLKKREPLTRAEYEMLKHHTPAGYCLLSHYLRDSRHISAIVARDHHERRNGSGYPRAVTDINPMVEIVIVSDVYDALLSPRPYRPKSFDNRSAVEVITEMAERGEISWDIVKVLVSQNRADKPDYHEVEVSLEKRGRSPEGNVYGMIVDDPACEEEPE